MFKLGLPAIPRLGEPVFLEPFNRGFPADRPSRREGRIFLRPRYVSLAWSQAADQYPDLSNGVRAAASSTHTIPTLNHITLGVTLPSPITTPVNGLGALISLIFGVNGPSRGGWRLGFRERE